MIRLNPPQPICVAIQTVLIGIFSRYALPYKWSWIQSILFGSILSATDPVAVVALLHDNGCNHLLTQLIDSESFLNDGVAFIIFSIFSRLLTVQQQQQVNVKDICIEIVKTTIGIATVWCLNHIGNQLEIEISLTFALTYIIFYVGDTKLGLSGILTICVFGIYLSKHKYSISYNLQQQLQSIWKLIVYFINICVFTIIGFILAKTFFYSTVSQITSIDFGYSILLYLIIQFIRLITIVILYPLIRLSGVKLTLNEYFMLVWSGLRGIISLIGVLLVYLENTDDSYCQKILFHVSIIVLLTLCINGITSKYLVKYLLKLNHLQEQSIVSIKKIQNYLNLITLKKLQSIRQNYSEHDGIQWNEMYRCIIQRGEEDISDYQTRQNPLFNVCSIDDSKSKRK
ncbi:unnamed protein product [Didymodactylos carnosus]|uniref:Cation/H+ exchanger transmembrane domain-containing protein n=1 Tax=Didymodactylos carnosus TaxID=1234261 RepID=A0A814XKM9_9BILA|nr:unnamed protein product [Didymodactylos carnosus]CAF3979209.1 unnamed protein product [Didymodactylos carnosus]